MILAGTVMGFCQYGSKHPTGNWKMENESFICLFAFCFWKMKVSVSYFIFLKN